MKISLSEPQPHPHLEEFGAFLKEFNNETERGAALAAAAMLDDLLLRTLEGFLIENEGAKALLHGANPLLGTFAAKIAATAALGLISEDERRECSLIRKIRNEFAHKVRMSFQDKDIVKLCDKLRLSVNAHGREALDSRKIFTMSAVGVILYLTNRPKYACQAKLGLREWPY